MACDGHLIDLINVLIVFIVNDLFLLILFWFFAKADGIIKRIAKWSISFKVLEMKAIDLLLVCFDILNQLHFELHNKIKKTILLYKNLVSSFLFGIISIYYCCLISIQRIICKENNKNKADINKENKKKVFFLRLTADQRNKYANLLWKW